MSLEMERRQIYYYDLIKKIDGTAVPTAVQHLTNFDSFKLITKALGLKSDHILQQDFLNAANKMSKSSTNKNPEDIDIFKLIDTDKEEEEVWQKIYPYSPLLRKYIEIRYHNKKNDLKSDFLDDCLYFSGNYHLTD